MLIHFVCSGNAYRSRLAEAYLNSLQIPSIKVMSSGSRANVDHRYTIMPYTVLLLEKYKLAQYASKDKIQLTQARFDAADVTICVNRAVYREAEEDGLTVPSRTFIWDITDVKDEPEALADVAEGQIPPITERTFHQIQTHVDELLAFLKRPKSTKQIDILDEHGKPTGRTSDINTIHGNGWIHGGVHVGLYTKQGGVVLERRSNNIIFNPGLWDLSMGGIIDSGEMPEEALLREVQEELGIELHPKAIKKLFMQEYNHYMPHYGFHNHNFTHTYIAEIPETAQFTIQPAEVAEARILDLDEAERMNLNNKKTFGKIIPTHAYNQRIIDAIRLTLAR